MRAAVCTGVAVIAVDPAPGDPLATGDVVNTAARLQSAAAPGGLVVGEETHRLTRHAFRLEPLPDVDAKGKAEPVAAWSVVEAVHDAGRPAHVAHAARRAGPRARAPRQRLAREPSRTVARTS